MRALLDVNVLIALHDADHVHHNRAGEWFEAHSQTGWASTPLTQNGCLRIMGQAGYSNPQPLSQLVQMLQRSTAAPLHVLWPDDISLLDSQLFRHTHMHSAKQLTDLYLLGLAVKHHGRFVTFDQRVPLNAVHGAKPGHLVVL
ncbi:MAG: VapC toxin family PIN domain ribonuclease [Comamonadaceae bacterium CG1_02_60_18]|nr:MAG: VapC toxin family PIN domain ribonuclease [Comamonadaceae bacterium CG1_02_60_18]PIQ53085.1 MAG: VapC toxin family PIN domain ribonuclease [Comamonadaceae bacterium CG12_big_fil_rev_8_21_14_0_65_59_15]